MRKWAFIVAIIGIFLLFLLSNKSPVSITSEKEIEKLQDNQKVIISGKVLEESTYGKSALLKMDNGLQLLCDCPINIKYQGKNITAIGIIDGFTGKKRIVVLKIKNDN